MRNSVARLIRPLLPVLLWAGSGLGLGAQVPAEKATAFERAVVQEMSDARIRPKAYAKYLRELRDAFEGNLWHRPRRVPLRTDEGVAALDEAIAFLEAARPVGPLRFNEGLALAARRHAQDLGPRGALEHVGSDGAKLSDRLNRLGTWHGLVAENISTGEPEARQVVIQLLVDDGVPSRGHRHNLFNPDLHQAGAGSAPHRDYRVVTVIDYADGFVPNP
ncbi:MAG: CAP domain-containing protein [Geothrix sp.]|uniref:CAP domain-containing protein n=1 Tax=Geothrix sp. TaxID=1962974 RepID=UPI0017A8AB87|nr:CAP domain-containing protein [Geothrix sp.]NWJ42375.1 CAP domain-containing protein [Geothrix sp.]WIL19658.1 MAG: CAP domain-containing protein [Geothrix sp.]